MLKQELKFGYSFIILTNHQQNPGHIQLPEESSLVSNQRGLLLPIYYEKCLYLPQILPHLISHLIFIVDNNGSIFCHCPQGFFDFFQQFAKPAHLFICKITVLYVGIGSALIFFDFISLKYLVNG